MSLAMRDETLSTRWKFEEGSKQMRSLPTFYSSEDMIPWKKTIASFKSCGFTRDVGLS